MSWTPGWELASPPRPAEAAVDAAAADSTPAELEASFRAAGSAAELAVVRSATARYLADHPDDPRALLVAAHAEILHGAAYDSTRRAKAKSYRRGIQLAERAMATSPELTARLAAGASLAEAATVLDAEHADAMLLWVTGVSYYFKECLSGVGHLINYRWMLRASELLDHLMAVAPDHEHGAVPLSLGIYYLALPASAGGDLARSRELLEAAVAEAGTESLLPRWGRAKYFAVKSGDREGFRRDLEWVLAQDPRATATPYAWNVYFQRDARALLAEIDEIF